MSRERSGVLFLTLVGLGALGLALPLLWPARPEPEAVVSPPAPTPPPPRVSELSPPPTPPVPPEPQFTVDHALELAGANGVVCPLEPPVDRGVARLVTSSEGAFLGVAVVADGLLVLSEVPPSGEGVLHVEGFAPAPIRWSEALDGPAQGGCDPSPVVLEPSATAVVGTVSNGSVGEPSLVVCGRSTRFDEEGGFYVDAEPDVPCVVTLHRHFGVFQWEDQRELLPRRGRDAVVHLDNPDVEAVLPLVLEPVAQGLRVTADWSGHGLVDEVVVSAGGVAASDDPVAFHLAAGGAPGETVDVVLADGEVVPMVLRALTFDDWLVEN